MKLFKINKISALLIAIVSLNLVACDDEIFSYKTETQDVVDVTSSSAYLRAYFEYGPESTDYMYSGIVYSCLTDCPEHDIKDVNEFMNYEEGDIRAFIDGAGYIETEITCFPNTRYAYRAYTCYSKGNTLHCLYGEVRFFTTENIPNDSYPIDLGLPSGTLWADANLGAEEPSDCGLYFSWGEVGMKIYHAWDNYLYGVGDGYSFELNKYNTSNYYKQATSRANGPVDDLLTLLPEDDAATYYLGSQWHIPTYAEWDELLNYCDWEWGACDGVFGYYVYGRPPYSNNYIFLPACQYSRNHINPPFENNDYSTGAYWSSTLYGPEPESAWHLYMTSYEHTNPYLFMALEQRAYGLTIRPVKSEGQIVRR